MPSSACPRSSVLGGGVTFFGSSPGTSGTQADGGKVPRGNLSIIVSSLPFGSDKPCPGLDIGEINIDIGEFNDAAPVGLSTSVRVMNVEPVAVAVEDPSSEAVALGIDAALETDHLVAIRSIDPLVGLQ